MKHVRTLAFSILCSGLLILPAAAQSSSSGSQSSDTKGTQTQSSTQSQKVAPADRMFMKKAAEANKAEIELGQLATQKASSDDVKKFGQRMVDDHSKASQDLEQIASKKGVTLPDKLNAKDEATKDRLDKLSGKQFDEAYMRDMVTDHKKDVSEFKREEKMAKDPDVKSFAQNTTPTLESHLQEAEKIAPKGMASKRPVQK